MADGERESYLGWELRVAGRRIVVRLRLPPRERSEMRKEATLSIRASRELGKPSLHLLQTVVQLFGHGPSRRDVGGIRLVSSRQWYAQ